MRSPPGPGSLPSCPRRDQQQRRPRHGTTACAGRCSWSRCCEEIVNGRIRPGEHLVTQALAERFGVSHTPIREALVALAGIGHGRRSRPTAGRSSGGSTAREVREICQVRRALECEAVRLACGRIDLAELDALPRELRAMIGRDGSPGPAVIAEARAVDSRLHDLIAASCGNAFLATSSAG